MQLHFDKKLIAVMTFVVALVCALIGCSDNTDLSKNNPWQGTPYENIEGSNHKEKNNLQSTSIDMNSNSDESDTEPFLAESPYSLEDDVHITPTARSTDRRKYGLCDFLYNSNSVYFVKVEAVGDKVSPLQECKYFNYYYRIEAQPLYHLQGRKFPSHESIDVIQFVSSGRMPIHIDRGGYYLLSTSVINEEVFLLGAVKVRSQDLQNELPSSDVEGIESATTLSSVQSDIEKARVDFAEICPLEHKLERTDQEEYELYTTPNPKCSE